MPGFMHRHPAHLVRTQSRCGIRTSRSSRYFGEEINQADLLAEVTRRPRRPDSAPRLGPDEMRRVAVHEAGHTTSRLLSSRKGADLSFITIVPRMDGSLGFV